MSDKTIPRVELLLIELRKKKTISEFLDHFANQYYIYGENRSHFMCWRETLQYSLERDALHFAEYNDPNYTKFMKRRGRKLFYHTRRTLKNLFDDVAELSCYIVEEAEQMDVVLNVLKESYDLAQRKIFKAKLAGEDPLTHW